MESLSAESIQGSFSVVVAAFLLIRLEKQMKSLTEAINELRTCQVCKFKEPAHDLQSKAL